MPQEEVTSHKPAGLVLALGGGGAPGIAHIGVLQGLADHGIPVRAVVGTSVGAEVGAFYAAGMPPAELIDLATRFDWRQTAQLFLPDLPVGGLVSGARIMDFLRQGIGTKHIEELAVGFAAVAADLETGEEVVIDHGEVVEAVRASISIPGLMAPHRYQDRVLVDGGVLNPLPSDVARRRFGGPVVAVATHAGARYATRMPVVVPEDTPRWVSHARQLLKQPWVGGADGLRAWLEARLEGQIASRSGKPHWTTWRVLDRVYAMAQTEIVRLRAASAPADLMIAPAVGDIGLLEFYRAREAIEAGRRAVEDDLPRLRALLHPEGS